MSELRITEHPILSEWVEKKEITFFFDGKPLKAYEGEPIAAALMAYGIRTIRKTLKKGRSRGVYCAIGRCTDCIMTVNGTPNIRTCITPVQEGIKVETQTGCGSWE